MKSNQHLESQLFPAFPGRLRNLVAWMTTALVLCLAPASAQVTGQPGSDPLNPRNGADPTPENPLLSHLILTLPYPKLEVFENRAYIPLFFIVEGSAVGADTIRVRATFAGGTATPGIDFSMANAVRELPVVGGLGSMSWIEIPTILDELNEGTETALFDISIDGSKQAPVRMEVSLLDDQVPGEVGFVSTRFSANEGATNGYAEIRMWRTRNTRNAATVTYRLEGDPIAMASVGDQPFRTAVFGPGESQVFVKIPLVNDSESQGTREITLTLVSSDDGMKVMKGLDVCRLTLADDETLPKPGTLSISETSPDGNERGVILTTEVPRGYQVRLEYSDNGLEGPWNLYWIFEGADTERVAFNRFDSATMRMFRIQPPEPLQWTFPW